MAIIGEVRTSASKLQTSLSSILAILFRTSSHLLLSQHSWVWHRTVVVYQLHKGRNPAGVECWMISLESLLQMAFSTKLSRTLRSCHLGSPHTVPPVPPGSKVGTSSVVPPTFLAVGIFIKPAELQLYFSQAGMQQMLLLAPVVLSLAPLDLVGSGGMGISRGETAANGQGHPKTTL